MNDDIKRPGFTLPDLPKSPVFEKQGVKLLGFNRSFQLVPPGQTVTTNEKTPPKQPALDTSRGMGRYDFRVRIPDYKPPTVKLELGREGESSRAFKPLAQSIPGKDLGRSP